MKSAKVLYKIAYLLIVVLVAVFTVGYAFAWFFDRKEAEFTISGSSQGAYFESGDGSAEKPFVISNPTHMHNLAVLQNTGKLDTKYYYEIKKTITEIDMSGRYIPPIGNDEHPFIGDFNGNGKTLAGLQVTTNKTLLKDEYPRHADTNYEFSQAVGLFGMTGADSNIHNLILDNPTVDVSATDTLYLTAAKDGVSPAAKAAGIAVGFVAGKVSSVGVRAANAALNVNMTGYSSFNSILGELADGVTSSVTGGGKPESGDVGYGAPTDLKELYEALGNKDGAAVEKQMALPFKVDNSKLIVPSSGTMNVELSSGVKPVSTATTQVATSSNIGYYIGADIKGYCKPKKVDYSKFYYPNNSSESFELPYTDYSGKVYPAPDSDVTDYLSKTGSYLMRMTGKTQVDVINESGLVVIPEGQVGSYKGPVLLPQRCVWVAPIMPGKLRFVFMNVESSAIGVRIVKLTRSVPGKYGTRFAGEREIIYNCNALMLSGKAYYIEMEVTQADINAGYEFAVAAGDGYNPYIAYIDIGANGGNVNLGEIDTQKNVSAVDFIYDGVEINQEKTGNEGGEGIQLGDFVIKASEPLTRYEASKTSIYFDNIKAAMEIVFLRLHNHEKGKTINLTNYTSDTIKTSELKATFSNFVLPEGITGGTSSGGSSGGGEVVEVPTTAINVTSEKTSIAIGETVQLSVEFTPSNATDRAIDWSIESGAEYATLNDVTGEITGTADGTVVVKAQCGQFTDTITLTIGNGTTTTVAVESVSLNKTSLSLTVDGSETLIATVLPSSATNKDVTWSSSAEGVAKVDGNGKVTAVGEGTAKITVTTADGGFTAQCTVTVSAAYTTVYDNDYRTGTVINGTATYPTAGGVYSYISGTPTSGSNSVTISGGKLVLADSSDVSTNAYVRLNNTYINTKVRIEGSVTQTDSDTSGNWSFLSLRDNDGNEIFALRTDRSDGKKIKVYKGTGFVSTASVAYSTNTPITFTIDIDLTNKKATVTVLDTVLGTDIEIDSNTFAGISMITAGASSRNATLDSFVAKVTDTASVVTPTTPTVSYVTITQGETASVAYGGSLKLDATVTMSDNTTNNNVTWSSGNTSVATVDSNGNITTNGVGTAVITATSTADSTQSASTTVTVTGFTVSYVINGHGTQPANVTNVIKLPATLPTLTETGYTFDGWFTDSALTKAATAGAAISGNTTLYAKWTASGSTGETIYTFTAGMKESGPSCDKADGSVKLGSSGTTQQNGYIKLTKSSGSITFTITGLSAGKNVTLAFTDRDSGTSTANLSFAITNLTESGSGYTVTADGNIVITINATGDYYFAKCVVTIT